MDRKDASRSIGPMIRTALGTLSVVAAIALSWPGVQVARADSSQPGEFERFMTFVDEASPGSHARSGAETCAAGQALQNAEAQAAKTFEQMKLRAQQIQQAQQAQAHAERGAGGSAPAVMMLNGRGYNYGAGDQPAAEIGRLHQELAQRRAPRS